jgi:hypothetical protein
LQEHGGRVILGDIDLMHELVKCERDAYMACTVIIMAVIAAIIATSPNKSRPRAI